MGTGDAEDAGSGNGQSPALPATGAWRRIDDASYGGKAIPAIEWDGRRFLQGTKLFEATGVGSGPTRTARAVAGDPDGTDHVVVRFPNAAGRMRETTFLSERLAAFAIARTDEAAKRRSPARAFALALFDSGRHGREDPRIEALETALAVSEQKLAVEIARRRASDAAASLEREERKLLDVQGPSPAGAAAITNGYLTSRNPSDGESPALSGRASDDGEGDGAKPGAHADGSAGGRLKVSLTAPDPRNGESPPGPARGSGTPGRPHGPRKRRKGRLPADLDGYPGWYPGCCRDDRLAAIGGVACPVSIGARAFRFWHGRHGSLPPPSRPQDGTAEVNGVTWAMRRDAVRIFDERQAARRRWDAARDAATGQGTLPGIG